MPPQPSTGPGQIPSQPITPQAVISDVQPAPVITPPAEHPIVAPAGTGISVMPAPAVRPQKPATIYSYNSRTIQHGRRAMRLANFLTIILVMAAIGGLIGLWLWYGSPTKVEDIPFINNLLKR